MTAAVALGSNLGDRSAHIANARAALESLPATRLVAFSEVFQTEPVGVIDQGRFLNAAALLSTNLAPGELLAHLHAIERSAGRDRSLVPRFGPRTLDLDLLLYDQTVLDRPDLTLPHPRMLERAFVLVPLAQIAPGLIIPTLGITVAQALARLPESAPHAAALATLERMPPKATPTAAKKSAPRPRKPASGDAKPGAPTQPESTSPSTFNPTFKPVDPEALRRFVIDAARLVRDDKCEDVVLLDVRALSQVTDYIIVASGTSERQMHSVLDHVQELGEKLGFKPFRSSTDERSSWILLDFVDAVVHLFEPNTRAHYDIEMLWGDAPRLEWERPDQQSRDRAGLSAG